MAGSIPAPLIDRRRRMWFFLIFCVGVIVILACVTACLGDDLERETIRHAATKYRLENAFAELAKYKEWAEKSPMNDQSKE